MFERYLALTGTKRHLEAGVSIASSDLVETNSRYPVIRKENLRPSLLTVRVQPAALRRCLRHLSLKHLRQIILKTTLKAAGARRRNCHSEPSKTTTNSSESDSPKPPGVVQRFRLERLASNFRLAIIW